VQSKDKVTSLPVWVVNVIDADPEARDKTARVKVGDRSAGAARSLGRDAVVPVEFTGLIVTPYANQGGRLAYSLKATGVPRAVAGEDVGATRHGAGRSVVPDLQGWYLPALHAVDRSTRIASTATGGSARWTTPLAEADLVAQPCIPSFAAEPDGSATLRRRSSV
jgi:hypothetical protein